MALTDIKEGRKGLSDLKDPFRSDCVKRFSTWCAKLWSGKWTYTGTIEFQNGNTKGEQKFDAENFGGLLKKMEIFIEELEKQNGKKS